MQKMIISLIPAKAKSSEIKNKNFLKIKKKTLIEIAILSSLNCNDIHQTFVQVSLIKF